MINCIAIDDSPLALELIEDYIHKINYLHLVKSCTNALEAIESLRKGNVDLLFLDIHMPDISGIDLLRSLKVKPKIIFTTAYPNYALEGFNQNASDYLLKPFSLERFKVAVEKVDRQLKLEGRKSIEKDHIFIKSGYESLKIEIKDILYIEALKDYIQIFTAEQKILSLMSMKDILEMLPAEKFKRVHRSFIISADKISRVAPRKVYIGTKEVPLGDIYRDAFQTFLKAKNII